MSFKLFRGVVNEASKEGVFQIAIGGGEPFCHPKIWEILTYLNKKGITTNITTNGILIGMNEIKKLERFANIGRIQISLDGTNSIKNDYSRSNFKDVEYCLKGLSDSNLRIGINCLLRNSNINDLNNMYEFCRRHKIISLNLLRLKPPITDSRWFEDEKLNSNSIDTLRNFLDQSKKKGYPEIYLDASMCYLFQDMHEYNLRSNDCLGCSAGINFLTILPNGDILPCTHMKNKIGNITDGIKNVWQRSPMLGLLRNKRKWISEPCKSCTILSYCGGCRALSLKESGKFWSPDRECLIYKKMICK